jgi:hypothetical protein
MSHKKTNQHINDKKTNAHLNEDEEKKKIILHFFTAVKKVLILFQERK